MRPTLFKVKIGLFLSFLPFPDHNTNSQILRDEKQNLRDEFQKHRVEKQNLRDEK